LEVLEEEEIIEEKALINRDSTRWVLPKKKLGNWLNGRQYRKPETFGSNVAF